MAKEAVNKRDQILMQLAHYFITVENYTPIVVRGVKNELWLENLDAPYRIIRINTNYIHNNEQLDFDLFKIKNVVKQVKKKTLSFKINTLNILLDVGNSVNIKNTDRIECIKVDGEKDIKKAKDLNELFPELKNNLLDAHDGLDFLINVTNDINVKTEKENREFEKVFKKKKISITYILMAVNIVIFLIGILGLYIGQFDLYTKLALNRSYVKSGEIYRLLTTVFTHKSIIHLGMNMYALYIIGSQVETYIGKKKYIFVYLFSGIAGSLLSCIVNSGWSLGASGAIFGLMGTLLYFGIHYRMYLESSLKSSIIPLIISNLALGFIIPNIDNAAHIGGLVGGLFLTMAVGIENKGTKQDRITGIVCSTIFPIALIYILFFI